MITFRNYGSKGEIHAHMGDDFKKKLNKFWVDEITADGDELDFIMKNTDSTFREHEGKRVAVFFGENAVRLVMKLFRP